MWKRPEFSHRRGGGEELHNRRPFAVMMNNIINACPQAGIEEAGVVYEAPVEGALTRLMALFDSVEGMEKIGSVRSCRTYYPMYAMEFDAIYTHYGQAVYAVELLNSDKVNNISGPGIPGGSGKDLWICRGGYFLPHIRQAGSSQLLYKRFQVG